MNTSDILNRAADLIEQRGWTAGDGWVAVDTMDTAPLCLEGGIQAAIGHALPSRIKEVLRACAVIESARERETAAVS